MIYDFFAEITRPKDGDGKDCEFVSKQEFVVAPKRLIDATVIVFIGEPLMWMCQGLVLQLCWSDIGFLCRVSKKLDL